MAHLRDGATARSGRVCKILRSSAGTLIRPCSCALYLPKSRTSKPVGELRQGASSQRADSGVSGWQRFAAVKIRYVNGSARMKSASPSFSRAPPRLDPSAAGAVTGPAPECNCQRWAASACAARPLRRRRECTHRRRRAARLDTEQTHVPQGAKRCIDFVIRFQRRH